MNRYVLNTVDKCVLQFSTNAIIAIGYESLIAAIISIYLSELLFGKQTCFNDTNEMWKSCYVAV